jgi:hypothetical protein
MQTVKINHVPASAELGVLAKHLLSHAHNGAGSIADTAEIQGLPERVQRVLRAAIPAGGIDLADGAFQAISQAFSASLAPVSAFDRLLNDGAVRLPLNTRIAAVTAVVAGAAPLEGKAKPISRLSLDNRSLPPRKAVAIFVVSEELARSSEPGAAALLATELRNGVSVATNTAFLDAATGILGGITPIPSAGDPLADCSALLDGVALAEASKPFWIMEPSTAKRLSTWTAGAALLFPGMSAMGGELVGLPAIVSSLPPGFLVLVDAAGIGLADQGVLLDRTSQATIEMDDAPLADALGPTPAATLLSLWPTNSTALRGERFFSWAVLRDRAIAAVSDVNWSSAP